EFICYKILWFGDGCHLNVPHRISQFEIYRLNSNSWKVVDGSPEWYIKFDQRSDKDRVNPTRNIAYIIGNNGYFKQVDLGESAHRDCCPFVCSYLPSSIQIKQAACNV
ncbi:unnamed protein product, partial [Thlaspi arvense]